MLEEQLKNENEINYPLVSDMECALELLVEFEHSIVFLFAMTNGLTTEYFPTAEVVIFGLDNFYEVAHG